MRVAISFPPSRRLGIMVDDMGDAPLRRHHGGAVHPERGSTMSAWKSRDLARSADGYVIHRAECRHARAPWNWADRATDDQLLRAKLVNGLRVCKVCDPSFRREAP
jgi:hypothetical protein